MKRFVICTSVGAIGRADGAHGDPNASRGLSAEREIWVNDAVSDGASLEDAVREFRPTCLLGLAAHEPARKRVELLEWWLELGVVVADLRPTEAHAQAGCAQLPGLKGPPTYSAAGSFRRPPREGTRSKRSTRATRSASQRYRRRPTYTPLILARDPLSPTRTDLRETSSEEIAGLGREPVSYTHLTLPTILLV